MRKAITAAILASLVMAGIPSSAQVRTIDPNRAIDSDLRDDRASLPPRAEPVPVYPDEPVPSDPAAPPSSAPLPPSPDARASREARADATIQAADTFKRDDLITAGEDVFGRGAAGFGSIVERILKDQGEPNAYIAGHEASGAFIVGLRYGSGVMTHKIEGQRPVYWTGPSIGFDVGGDADKVFVLVYNLYDSQDLFKRFPAAEGRLYLVGGFAATYLRRGTVVLIPVRLGVGWRAGINVGYMNFTQKSRWLPF